MDDLNLQIYIESMNPRCRTPSITFRIEVNLQHQWRRCCIMQGNVSPAGMQVGRWKSLIGSSTALALMTVISVAIGAAFKSLPDVLKSSLPVGQYLGAALMLLFGVRTIKASVTKLE